MVNFYRLLIIVHLQIGNPRNNSPNESKVVTRFTAHTLMLLLSVKSSLIYLFDKKYIFDF